MDKLAKVYDKLLDYYLTELEKDEPDVLICKEARELLKAMKYEAPLVSGSKQEKVAETLKRFPNFNTAPEVA